ncbi:lysoplasmalogenase family protein [Vibrio aphrogenes]|uniref:lysoplasmalogenase family protein n=1 Tax=Vibrio aphrogenes TaxID=1891186 RepID=UPI000B34D537|nr:lysoplasmalogenase family protein [Vibrio aphrogenes]
MWYWLLMGALLLLMLSLMKLNKPKLFSASKLTILVTLTVILLTSLEITHIASLWSFFALAFFMLCYGVDAFAPRHRVLQLIFFSIACLGYSLDFWAQVETLNWAVPIALFALIVVVFFLLLPLLESFIIEASLVAVILWQLSWASGQLWQDQHSLLALSGFIGTLLLAASVLIWSIHYLKKPFKFSYEWLMLCYFSAHILVVAPLVLQ